MGLKISWCLKLGYKFRASLKKGEGQKPPMILHWPILKVYLISTDKLQQMIHSIVVKFNVCMDVMLAIG